MSKLAKLPLKISSKVKVSKEGSFFVFQGPKGTIKREVSQHVNVEMGKDEIKVSAKEEGKEKALLGTEFALIRNALMGVENGFEKKLLLVGVGYKAQVSGNVLDLSLGFSHPVKLPIPEGLTVTVDKQTTILVAGADKQKVGLFAAEIREIRKPEPYKGKGVRYDGEVVKLKAGKSAGKK